MNFDMKFEMADINDLLSLVKLRTEYLIEDYGEIPEDKLDTIKNNLPAYFQKHLNDDLFVFVCRDKEEIVSCCFLCVSEKPSNPTFINGKIGTVLNVYTKPKYRRNGIAGTLLKMLIAESEKLGLDFVELKATDSGYDLYKSIGFKDTVSKYHNMKYVIDLNNESD